VHRVFVVLSFALGGLLVVAPLATMVVERLRVDRVVTTDGRVYEGQIKDRDAKSVTIRPQGEMSSLQVARAEIASEGRVWSFAHYRHIGSGPGEKNMLVATLALAGASTLFALLLGLPLGVLLAGTDVAGRRLLETLFVLPLVLPPILLAIATHADLLVVKPEFLRAVLVFGLSLFPLVMLFTARAVRATGADALDAARLQTTPREALLRVVLGPALPGAAAGALLVFAFVVADFAVPDFLGVTTAKNTILVYANVVFSAWNNDGDAGAATAAGMPPTLLALVAFGLVLWVEARRGAATLGQDFREPDPLPLGRWRLPLTGAAVLLLLVCLVWPAWRHLETAAGKDFGPPVATQGAAPKVTAGPSARPQSLLDGLRRGLRHDRVGKSALTSLLLAGGGALLAVLLALLFTEAGYGAPRLDKVLLVMAFLPVAVPPMSFAVGWVRFFGPARAQETWFPVLLMAARLLPFAAFAVRATRRRVGPELGDAAAVAGLGPLRRYVRGTLPLVAPGALLGLLLAFLFGLREVDALVFTKTGAETLPVQLYNMIHYGYDVEVAGLSFLWAAGLLLFLLLLRLVLGTRFRVLP